MTSADFVIPQKLEDLFSFSNEKYTVSTDYNADEVTNLIRGKNSVLK